MMLPSQTTRLHYRQLSYDDLEALVTLDSDPLVMRYIGRGQTNTRDQTAAALERILATYEKPGGFGLWCAELIDDATFIGWFCLKPLPDNSHIEVGYRLLRDHWGKGYATEGARAILAHGFDVLQLDEIVATILPDNSASIRVVEKCGLQHRGATDYPMPDGPIPCQLYAMTRAQWQAQQR